MNAFLREFTQSSFRLTTIKPFILNPSMKLLKALWLPLFASTLLLALPAVAEKKCDGPPDLCAQVVELQRQLAVQKATSLQGEAEAVKAEVQAADQRLAEKAAKFAAVAAVIAVALKIFLSALGGWKDYFTTTKGKAWLRLITLIVGFLAFVATNLGLGIVWWQALIVAAGGPGAILVHEVLKIIPALRGKGPLPPSVVTNSPAVASTDVIQSQQDESST
jgi:hypothetical protein